MRQTTRSRRLAGAAILCAHGVMAEAREDARADLVRSAAYDHLLGSGFTLNRGTPRMYCLAVEVVRDGRVERADPAPEAMPRGSYDAPVEPRSRCVEGGLVFYASPVRWEGDVANVDGGLHGIHSSHPNVRQPKPDRRTLRLERHPERGWVVTYWTMAPPPGKAGPAAPPRPEAAAALRYWPIVERYGQRGRQEAVDELRKLTDADIWRELRIADRRPLRRAALLHTDLAFSGPKGTLSPRFGRHLDFARALLEGAGIGESGGRDFGRRWFAAVTLKAHETADGALGRKLARAGLRAFPDAPELMVAWARLEEAIAGYGPVWRPTAGDRTLSEAGTWGFRPPALTRRLEIDAALREARRLFSAVLDADPGHLEARLRLAHVQIEVGELEAAAANLEGIVAGRPDPETAYLAGLLQGRIAERRERFQGAVEAYGRVVAARPGSQTGWIALSQALHRLGRIEEARGALAEALALPPGPDPYRAYLLAGPPTGEERLEALRQEAER